VGVVEPCDSQSRLVTKMRHAPSRDTEAASCTDRAWIEVAYTRASRSFGRQEITGGVYSITWTDLEFERLQIAKHIGCWRTDARNWSRVDTQRRAAFDIGNASITA